MSVPTTRSLSQVWRSRAHRGSPVCRRPRCGARGPCPRCVAVPGVAHQESMPLSQSFSPTRSAKVGSRGTGGKLGREPL
eukprot:4229527-Alexandrium_andersonii.AAC.1